jgi:Protein of unknown function (DUF3014)
MQQSPENQNPSPNKNNWTVVITIISILIIGLLSYLFLNKQSDPIPAVVVKEPIVEKALAEPVTVEEEFIEDIPEPEITVVEEIIEEVVVTEPLPSLDESDEIVREKLSSLTWRKELLKLVIDDDMVRRLVVFTDNFAQGIVAYEHSPLTRPSSKFSGTSLTNNDGVEEWLWDENSSKRFKLYVDFLRSFDVETLVNWYYELKPLIDESYGELGYPDDDFTVTLQDAITRVLDMDIPKDEIVLIRPSVMYEFKSEELESMSDTDKLLLRLGKENLLVIKSVLLEFSDKLGRRRGE